MQAILYGGILFLLLLFSNNSLAETWTLGSSIERAYQFSPEIKLAENELESRQSVAANAAFWPNPTVDVRMDNKLGLEDGSGGYDINDVGITQPIPLNRIKYKKAAAQANAEIASYELMAKRLQVEADVAKDFHLLQYAQAEYVLAKERLRVADEMVQKSVKNKQGIIVRYMTPLEKMRLNILKEEAVQKESGAEGEYKEALAAFVKRLSLDSAEYESVTAMQEITSLEALQFYLDKQQSHANLAAMQQTIVAARAQVDAAKSQQLDDPSIRLSRTVDYFSQGEDVVYGVTLNVQIPLWNTKTPEVIKAEYSASRYGIELQQLNRELIIQVKQSYTHLGHLIGQVRHHSEKLLTPSTKILELTNKGFVSGELGLLTLIDANNTYFDAQLRYSELSYQAWIEYAELRLAAGILLVSLPAADIKRSN